MDMSNFEKKKFIGSIQTFVDQNKISYMNMNIMSQDTILGDSTKVMLGDTLVASIISGAIAMLVVCLFLKSIFLLSILGLTLLAAMMNSLLLFWVVSF